MSYTILCIAISSILLSKGGIEILQSRVSDSRRRLYTLCTAKSALTIDEKVDGLPRDSDVLDYQDANERG